MNDVSYNIRHFTLLMTYTTTACFLNHCNLPKSTVLQLDILYSNFLYSAKFTVELQMIVKHHAAAITEFYGLIRGQFNWHGISVMSDLATRPKFYDVIMLSWLVLHVHWIAFSSALYILSLVQWYEETIQL